MICHSCSLFTTTLTLQTLHASSLYIIKNILCIQKYKRVLMTFWWIHCRRFVLVLSYSLITIWIHKAMRYPSTRISILLYKKKKMHFIKIKQNTQRDSDLRWKIDSILFYRSYVTSFHLTRFTLLLTFPPEPGNYKKTTTTASVQL